MHESRREAPNIRLKSVNSAADSNAIALYASQRVFLGRSALTNSNHNSELFQQEAPGRGPSLTRGVVSGLLIGIPLWVLIDVVLVRVFQEGPLSEATSLVFMIAAVCEAILARYALRTYWPGLWRHGLFALTGGAENGAAESSKHTIGTLEKFTGRKRAWVEDMLRFVSAPTMLKPRAQPARVQAVQRSTLRHTAAFGALAIAYLLYYFADVSLQIASLHSVTVFVVVIPLQKFAT